MDIKILPGDDEAFLSDPIPEDRHRQRDAGGVILDVGNRVGDC